MVNLDVIYSKINQIQTSLERIQTVTKSDPESLNNIDIQDIFIINLQRAIQSSIDLASHIVADEKLGLPDSLRDNFILLKKKQIIDTQICEALCKMVGFRNIAVHDYTKIDTSILKKILQNHLQDLERFYAQIIKYYQLG